MFKLFKVGKDISSAANSEEAIRLAKLDWEVISKKIFVEGQEIPGYIANVIVNNDKLNVVGIVSEQYGIVQNSEAFSFADFIDNIKYEFAGTLFNNKKVWMSARYHDMDVLGQKIENYLIFSTHHDGKGSIRISIVPVMNNVPLNLPLPTPRNWSTSHSGNFEKKMEQAKETLGFAENYLNNLISESIVLSETQVSEKGKAAFIEKLLPISPNDGDRKIDNIIELRNSLTSVIDKNENFKNTQWELATAVSEMVTNLESRRQSSTFEQNKFNAIVCGHYLIDKAYKILKDKRA